MTGSTHDCADLDRLLHLIGLLGDPKDPGFWDSWRAESHGYSFDKIKAGIACLARDEPGMHDHWAYDFADYVLMLFDTSSPEEEQRLVKDVGGTLSSGSIFAVGTQYLSDLRATAWHVWREHKRIGSDTVIQQWQEAPQSSEHEKWRALRKE
ncbi:hypothetical protein [Streptomyces cyaneofuscatus]